jgi:selenocysteine-specific elongation factor
MLTHPIVLGTAGHIDHGKTALVRALTGIDTDRLKVEKERGITTELGFAHLDLDGRRFGVVDVPGHERFIKSMVAGATGLDLVALVIAADEGVMPQTREHLDICHLLGVRRGVVALTKRDLVDDEWLALVTAEVRAYLVGSFLEDAPIVPLSVKSGAGLDVLRAELVRLTTDLGARPDDGSFRLPLDRIFTIKGFGTVVTGTVLGGAVAVGDAVVVHPRGLAAKVRGIEVHGEAVPRARAGMRCAINLAGPAVDDLARGDLLAHPGVVEPSHLLDARFRYLATSRAPLGPRSKILLHHGTAQLLATLVLVDRERLAPGEEALVQLHLDSTSPLAALPGDPFIARGFVLQANHGTTLGGGEIVRIHAPKLRRRSEAAAETLRGLAGADRDRRVALEVLGAATAALGEADLIRRIGVAPAKLRASLDRLVAAGDLIRAGDGDAALYLHAETAAHLERAVLEALQEVSSLPRADLRGRLPRALPSRLYDGVLDALVRRGAVEVERDEVRRTVRQRPVERRDPLDAELADRFVAWGRSPPRPADLATELGKPEAAIRASLARLLGAGALIKVKPDFLIDVGALDVLRASLAAHLELHGQITPPEWKELCGTTRKWAIPLAEHFDAEKLTLRVGELRKRRGG